MHPLFTLLFDPLAGSGFNMLAILTWLCIALCVLCVALEQSFKE